MPLLVLPGSLAEMCGLEREIAAQGGSIRQVLADASARHPHLGTRLLDEAGGLRRYYTLFLNDADARPLGGLDACVCEGDLITVLPPVAGGAAGLRAADTVEVGDPPQWLGAIRAHAEEAYPEEACGLVFSERAGELQVVAVGNVAGDRRERFELSPGQLVDALLRARQRGAALQAIYHSHPDGPAALSPEDLEQAMAGGEPLWRDVGWLVVSVSQGRAGMARLFRWRAGGFTQDPLPIDRK